MILLLCSLYILVASLLAMLVLARFRKVGEYLFLWSIVTACGLGILSAVSVLCNRVESLSFRAPWHIPFGEFYIGIDFLSAFFLLLFFVLSLSAGIYGYGYLRDYKGKRSIPIHLAFFHLLIIAIMLVLVAKNAILFLVAWELMTLSAYFLITFYDEKESVRRAGYIYFIATHTGVFCLFIMFLLMGAHAGSMNFDQMAAVQFPLGLASLLFILALIGFGVKAGFIPFHIWLPHAHPAAPSYISALLSGVVIKIGIYGLMRMLAIIKDFPSWCGILLLMIGVISGVGGVLYALGQHEIKKLLAYHSIENIGIITLGLGMGMLGHVYHQDTVSFIGYTAALLHVFNHAIFKGLLFLSAGSVIRTTHTGEIDHMGGLLKVLPYSGYLFLIGSLSICGLPLFNGFISEWLVYQSLLGGVFHLNIYGIIFSSIAIVGLALIGGLAALCFAKAFGAIFLGVNRTHQDHPYTEGDWMLRAPMILLAAICVWVGLFPVAMVSFAFLGAQATTGLLIPSVMQETVINPLLMVTKVLSIGVLIFAILSFLRKMLLSAYPALKTETWGCGFAASSPRVQYTASSFAKPILKIFRTILVDRINTTFLKKYFPAKESLSSSVVDASEDLLFRPIFYSIKKSSRRLKWIQSGHTQKYLLYIFFFLLFLLMWKL